MKSIHLIRHAKSSWDDYNLADIDRPLKQRGVKDCQIMAVPIAEAGCDFENVYASPACRAQQTIELLAQHLPDRNIVWHTEDQLYSFSYEALLNWIQALDDSLNEVVLVGHNPALTDLCNQLSGSELDNLPTCGYVQIVASVQSWDDIRPSSGKLCEFLRPKQFKKA